MAARLRPLGFQRVRKGEKADLYIINTCTVTHRADQSSRNLIHRAARENPAGRIVVTGCYAHTNPEKILGMEGVDLIVRNAEKEFIPEILSKHLPDLFDSEPATDGAEPIADFSSHNRAWLKISDGCNQRCSYCILPAVRGNLRNRDAAEILAEINGMVRAGFREIVLTGLNMGYYRRREATLQVKSFAELCRTILDRTDIKRIRFSSLEPQTITEDLLKLYAESDSRICRHFHLSMQSGSSRILRLMRRPYDREAFVERVRDIREARPDTTIGADVIVGFPSETGTDFTETKTLAESGIMDYLHVFSYSDRPGVASAEMPDKIKPDIIKERNAVLTRISNDLRLKANQRQVGETLGVIAEFRKIDNRFHWGISDNYIRVKLPESYGGGRDTVNVRITQAFADHVEGRIVRQK
jgi:threonylcarbamoyladenosine tRNA methylthiotransferase MtaB